MKDFFTYLQQLWNQLGFTGISSFFAVLAALFGILSVLWNLGVKLWNVWQQRQLQNDLHPFYTAQEIQHATQYYVETTCQNVAPSREEEPRDTYDFSAKEKIIPFFLNKAFKTKKDACQFYIVLADSGMGKTTFLLNLYLRYIDQFFGVNYQIKLLPFNFPDIDKEIEKIPDKEKRQTILLLDAFDEDIQAVADYKTRLGELIRKVIHFREVVITCRTQFFPREEEVPGETGVLRSGPEGGEREFRKFYISPFDENDIQTYLKKRFSWFQRAKKQTAKQIVMSCPNLMVRPMLLSYIEDLLQNKLPYTSAYMVYAELINKWIEREVRKVPSERRKRYMDELYKFSREIAVDIYRHRAERQGSLLIRGKEIQPFADKHGIKLSDIEMKSKSLLNRNARGDYKFSHKSVMEYFLAEEAFFNAVFRQELDFKGMDRANAFFDEMICEKLTVPFFSHRDVDDVIGEYCLKDGKPKLLTTLPEKLLPDIIYLKLQEWKNSDDMLLFTGLKNLKHLGFSGTQRSVEQKNELQHILPNCNVFHVLRSESLIVSTDDFLEAFGLDSDQRPLEYIQNEYKDQGKVMFDCATGLMWQKSGSNKRLTYNNARVYVKKLNKDRFAGYNDWRLPTIPELMSLLEPEKSSNGLYIDSIFDKTQFWCWSADRPSEGGSSSAAWSVDSTLGFVYWRLLDRKGYVRAVRS